MDHPGADHPLWLSHHVPEQHDRCRRIGSTLVCRRCAVLYPLVVVWTVLALLADPPSSFLLVGMWLLPLPMSLEWLAEQHGGARYSPVRQVTVTAIASAGVGAALAAHVRQPLDVDALAPMATHVTICGVSSVVAWRRGRTHDTVTGTAGRPSWEVLHDRAEAERMRSLERLLHLEDGEPASRD